MSFESDIFVSYAHIDDQALVEGEKGWISTFHRALEVRLAQLRGRETKIWRDPKLQGNDVFADRLSDQLTKVALLVSVLSPRYVQSDWCRREVREFYAASEKSGGPRVGSRLRIFKVVKTPIPMEELPAPLDEVLGYEFYIRDPETGRARELSHGSAADDQRLFWSTLDDLAHDITELLGKLDDGSGSAGAAGDGPTVYLAETAHDLKNERDALRRDFLDHGYRVLPDRPLPLVDDECREVVAEQLAEAELAVHPVGRSYGLVPDGGRDSLVVLQHELATARGLAAELPRLVWLAPDVDSDDERQQAFIQALETDAQPDDDTDLLRVPLEELKSEIHRRLAPAEEAVEEPEVATEADGDEGPRRIYIICDQRDLEAIEPLSDHLFDAGFEVIEPVFDGDEGQVRQDHQESLVECDAVLIYYGAGNELWLRSKLRELQKCAGYGRGRPFLAKTLYVAPPADRKKDRLRTRDADVVREEDGFDPALLADLVARL